MYIVLKKNNYKKNKLEFKPFSEKFLEKIRLIRNKQKKILRQNKSISAIQQINYFNENIKKNLNLNVQKIFYF